MRILTRYTGRAILEASLLVLLVFVALQIFIIFTNELEDLGKGKFGLSQIFFYMLLRLPEQTYELLPMVMLLGSVLGMGWLASHSELIIMRTSGVSTWALGKIVLRSALLFVLVALVVGEGIAPYASNWAEQRKTLALSGGHSLQTAYGVWLANDNNFLHIKALKSNKQLEGVTYYELAPDHQLKSVRFAKNAEFIDGAWIFRDISESIIGDEGVKARHVEQEHWPVNIEPQWLGAEQDAAFLSIVDLYHLILYQRAQGIDTSEFQLSFWSRLLRPIAMLLMCMIAVPFVLGPLRSSTMGFRMLVGVLVGFGFYVLNEFLGPLSLVYQFPPILAALLPLLIMSLLAWMLFHWAR